MPFKILLIEPPIEDAITEKVFYKHPLPPLWALSLAAYLKKKTSNIDVRILDGQILSLKNLLDKIKRTKPEIIGISPKAASYSNALILARKSKSMQAKVILGGHHATGLKKEILKNRGPYSKDYCVDGIIQQDGERAFYEYVTNEPFDQINNFVYQLKQGIKENSIESLILDKLPNLDRDSINLDAYFKYYKKDPRYNRPLNIYSSRGCSWRKYSLKSCIFCPHMEMELRLKKPSQVRQEINNLVTKYRCNLIRDCSDDFLNNRRWFEQFFKISITDNNSVPLRISTRADKISPAIVKKFIKINIDSVSLGIESMSDHSLRAMSKGTNVQINKRAINHLLKGEFSIKLFFVLGAPGETRETLMETIKFIKELFKRKVNKFMVIKINILVPLPNSSAWQILLKKTKNKYQGKDLINFYEARADWLKYFCKIDIKDIIEACQELKRTLALIGNNRIELQVNTEKVF